MKTCFVVMTLGNWGRGKSLKQAALKCAKMGACKTDRAVAWYITGDDAVEIDEKGYMVREPSSVSIIVGKGFKLEHLTQLEGCKCEELS